MDIKQQQQQQSDFLNYYFFGVPLCTGRGIEIHAGGRNDSDDSA